MSLIEQALQRMRRNAPSGTAVPAGPALTAGGRPKPSNWALAQYLEQPAETDVALPADANRRIVPVDVVALRAAGLLPPESYERKVARQFRYIKLPLAEKVRPESPDFDPQACLIMVASALPGDGKTFCAVNLAFSMARERDTEALIVDADVAKPHISSAFGLAGEPGLVDALRDSSVDVESLVLRTDVEGLSILPAGQFEEDSATELLSSARMKQIVAQLALLGRRRRVVVFDTSPVLLTTESRVLSSLMGQVVFVVAADKTPRRAVYDALDRLGEGKQIGFVFNQSVMSGTGEASDYYGYGAYGGYGTYGGYANYGKPAADAPADADRRT